MSRRTDPQRRERILQAALDLIAEQGVAGMTYRSVSARADVPLGSMTYHFESRDLLLEAAFRSFVADMHGRFDAHLAEGDDPREGVVAIIREQGEGRQRDMVLATEMYAMAVRDPRYREMTQQWMEASRQSLRAHFDADLTPMLDALLEGLILHAQMSTEPFDEARVRGAVRRLTSGVQ